MSNSPHKMSVLMGVYNAEKHLRRSVASILAQTMKDFEFIIVDDCSTDGTWEYLDRLASMETRIKVLRNSENLGLTKSLNKGLSLVRSGYIVRQDADDFSYPFRLQKQLMYLEQNPDCVALGSQMLVVDENNRPKRLWISPLDHDEIDFRFMNGFGGSLAHPTLAARTNTILDLGGYNDDYHVAQDMDLLLRMAEVGKLANLPDVLVRYQAHGENISSVNDDRKYQCVKSAVLNAWKRRGLGSPYFDRFPNPEITIKEPSRTYALMVYGIKNIFGSPMTREGWSALYASLRRLIGYRSR